MFGRFWAVYSKFIEIISLEAPWNYSAAFRFNKSSKFFLESRHIQIHDLWIFEPLVTLIYGFGYTNFLKFKKTWAVLEHILNITSYETTFWHFWKRRGPSNDEDPSNNFLNILPMGSISSWKHEMILGKI